MEWLFLCIPIAIALAAWPPYQRFSINALTVFGIYGLVIAPIAIFALLFLAAEQMFHDLASRQGDLFAILGMFVLMIPAFLGMMVKLAFLPVAGIFLAGVTLLFLPGVIVIVVRYIHFLMVPHPAEEVLKASKDLPQQELVDRVADAMYKPERDGMPQEWQSDNWRRRVEALTKRVEAEDTFLKTLIDKARGTDRSDR